MTISDLSIDQRKDLNDRIVKIIEWTGESVVKKAVKVDAYWDRFSRSYIIQKLDENGYQVGDAICVGNKADRDVVVADLMREIEEG